MFTKIPNQSLESFTPNDTILLYDKTTSTNSIERWKMDVKVFPMKSNLSLSNRKKT